MTDKHALAAAEKIYDTLEEGCFAEDTSAKIIQDAIDKATEEKDRSNEWTDRKTRVNVCS